MHDGAGGSWHPFRYGCLRRIKSRDIAEYHCMYGINLRSERPSKQRLAEAGWTPVLQER